MPERGTGHDAKRSGLKRVSWRAAPSLWPTDRPPGFISPCEPTLMDRPPAGPGWLHEIKHDGFRILAWKQGERVTLWSRRGADFTGRFSRIADAVRSLSADKAMIDGVPDDGQSDFRAFLTKHEWEQAALVARVDVILRLAKGSAAG
jgi:bifunctional non-homologous end joining protein LigD